MKVSIFNDGTYITGADYSYTPAHEAIQEKQDEEGTIIQEFVPAVLESGNPDCIKCIDVEFDPTIERLEIVGEDVNIISLETVESPEEKKARITQLLITAENYEETDTEGVTFEKSDIGPMIIARFFGGDTNAEMAYLQRWNYLKDIERTEVQEVELEIIKRGYEAKEAFKNFILYL